MALDWNAVGALEPYRVRFLGQSCIGLRLVPWSLARFVTSFLGQSYQESPFRPVHKNISLAATPKKVGVGRCNANAVATPTALCTSMTVSPKCALQSRKQPNTKKCEKLKVKKRWGAQRFCVYVFTYRTYVFRIFQLRNLSRFFDAAKIFIRNRAR